MLAQARNDVLGILRSPAADALARRALDGLRPLIARTAALINGTATGRRPAGAAGRDRCYVRPVSTAPDPRAYPDRPYLAVSAAIIRDGRVLVARRARGPALGVWTLPGGVVEAGETLIEALVREIDGRDRA